VTSSNRKGKKKEREVLPADRKKKIAVVTSCREGWTARDLEKGGGRRGDSLAKKKRQAFNYARGKKSVRRTSGNPELPIKKKRKTRITRA